MFSHGEQHMDDGDIFGGTSPSFPWKHYPGDCDRSSAHYYKKNEYFRQIIIIRGSSKHAAGGVHILTDDQLMKMKLRMAEREKEVRELVMKERQVAKELEKADKLSQANSWRKKMTKGLKKAIKDISTSRHQPETLRNQLRKERQKIGALKKKWEREFNRANNFEREKREEEKKVKKMSDMIMRMRQMLVNLEEQNKQHRYDLDDVFQRLDEKEEIIELLNASLEEARERKEKLEQELARVLKDTADVEFGDLNEIHFSLLRKTAPIAMTNMAQKYEPVFDENDEMITLGGGAFGRVFAYQQKRRKGKIVAMKILHATADDYAVRRQEIVLEARLLRLFTGMGVFPHVHGVGHLGIDTAIAMEFLGDDSNFKVMTLNSWTRTTSVSVDNAKTVLLDVLSALHALHSEDILHNDIKGDNVVVRQSDHDLFSGYLIDLGNASTTYISAVYDFGRTERDFYEDDPLTIHYAPELIFNGEATTTSSDVYQIGQLIYILGEDLNNEDLKEIGERCTQKEPLRRLKLLEAIELVRQV